MQIDYISDFHLDFHIEVSKEAWQAKLTELPATINLLSSMLPEQTGDILVIAGDLSHSNRQAYTILDFFSSIYPHVLFVFGNHDYYLLPDEQNAYDKDSQKRESDLRQRIQDLPNVTCLANFETFTYQDVTFAGATSWYPLQTESERHVFYEEMNDSKLIQNLDIAATHKQEMQALEQLEPVDVLITHVPPIELNSHRYFGSTDCFLNKLPSGTAKLYIFGHCHEQNVYEQNDATYYINALGYPWEGLDAKIQSIHY